MYTEIHIAQSCFFAFFNLIVLRLQSLPFLLKNFITEEVKKINRILKERHPSSKPVQDPSDAIVMVLCMFNDWYNLLRQPLAISEDLKSLAEKTHNLLELLKMVFPYKSGKKQSVFYVCPLCVRTQKTLT